MAVAGSVSGTPHQMNNPPELQKQMAAWTKVIDQAEKEIIRKASESAQLKKKLRQVEFEVASKARENAILEERIAEIQGMLHQRNEQLRSAATPSSIQPANLSSLLAAAAEVTDGTSALTFGGGGDDWQKKYQRAARELEMKREYLAEKEKFWNEEMEKLENLIQNRDEDLRDLRSELAVQQVERSQDHVTASNREVQNLRSQQSVESRVAELDVQLQAEKNNTAKAASEYASNLAKVKYELNEEKNKVAIFASTCVPLLEEFGLQVKEDDSQQIASSIATLFNELKTRTDRVASVLNSSEAKIPEPETENTPAATTSESATRLSISGSSEHGSRLVAVGSFTPATEFRWSRSKVEDGSFVPIEGNNSPFFITSADDVDCLIQLEAVFKRAGGVEDRLVATHGPLTTNQDLMDNVQAAASQDTSTSLEWDSESGTQKLEMLMRKSREFILKSEDGEVDVSDKIANVHVSAVPTSESAMIITFMDPKSENNDITTLTAKASGSQERDLILLVLRELLKVPEEIEEEEEEADEIVEEVPAASTSTSDPESSQAITITGETKVGHVLVASGRQLSDDAVDCKFQWYRMRVDSSNTVAEPIEIEGATTPNYKITPNDIGHAICLVTLAEQEGALPVEFVAADGASVEVSAAMQKFLDFEAEGKTLLFDCQCETLKQGISPGRILVDTNGFTLLKDVNGKAIQVARVKPDGKTRGSLELVPADEKVILFKDTTKGTVKAVMEDANRRDVCILMYRSAVERNTMKRRSGKKKSIFGK